VAPPSPPALDTPQGGASESSLNPRFNETLKQKLLDADKQRDQKAKAHQTSRNVASASPHPSPKIKSYGFTTGGNKYDPLNSSL
jgi:hypothetical protein